MNNRMNRAFTIIELVVVIGVIAILAGILISLIPQIMLKVKIADTNKRVDAIQSGMAMIGQNEGSAAFRLQQLTEYTGAADLEPGFSGIIIFGPPDPLATGLDVGLPTIGKRAAPRQLEDYGAWGYRGRSHLAFPWGKKFPKSSTTTASMMGPERFLMRQMSPFNTRKLLKIAGILPMKQSDLTWPDTQYMTNRKTSEGWNDAWGHPLVVASVLYQPTFRNVSSYPVLPGRLDDAWPVPATSTTVFDESTTRESSSSYLPLTEPLTKKALLDHMKLYQYNRSVYIAVAAAGPNVRVDEMKLKSSLKTDWIEGSLSQSTSPTNGVGNLDVLWNQVNWVCQQARVSQFDRDWSELSFDNPPWQGNKYDYKTRLRHSQDANKALDTTYSNRDEHCVLSAPLEYH